MDSAYSALLSSSLIYGLSFFQNHEAHTMNRSQTHKGMVPAEHNCTCSSTPGLIRQWESAPSTQRTFALWVCESCVRWPLSYASSSLSFTDGVTRWYKHASFLMLILNPSLSAHPVGGRRGGTTWWTIVEVLPPVFSFPERSGQTRKRGRPSHVTFRETEGEELPAWNILATTFCVMPFTHKHALGSAIYLPSR